MKNFFQHLRLLFLLREQEVIFKADPCYAFPVHEISSSKKDRKIIVTTTVLGLIGYFGILPDPIKTWVITQGSKKDVALADFLNIFHNRLIHLLYAVWESQHLLVLHEHHKNDWSQQPALSFVLGLTGVPNKKYSALLVRYHQFFGSKKSALGLQLMLQDYFECLVTIHSFMEEWFSLADNQKTHLSFQNSTLGIDMVLGEGSLFLQNKFLIEIGPLGYRDYCLWQPGGGRMSALKEITSLYVGEGLEFDVNVGVDWESIPGLCLSGTRVLGWDSWLLTGGGEQSIFQNK